MNLRIRIKFLFVLAAGFLTGQTTKRVLFLGNSYTGVNNLPQLTSSVALSAADTLIFDSNTPGGYTFQGHSTNATSLSKIALGTWDFVVLQEQSQMPSFPINQVENSVFPYARKLDSLINVANPCTETMFYMTWGRKYGDAGNCSVWPPVCTYDGMDSLLRLRYMMMADSNNAVVSAVGSVWNYIIKNFPLIELYQTDYSHPSLAGSYAAACCFYTSIFRKDPTLISFNSTLNASDASTIRSAVKTVVYDSLSKWFIGKYDPVAAFNYSSNGSTFTFNNSSQNSTQYFWQFGDGDTSTFANPTHSYSSTGTYTVSLVAENCGMKDTSNIVLNYFTTDLNESSLNQNIVAYPNPTSSTIQIKIDKDNISQIAATDILGKTFLLSYEKNDRLLIADVSELEKGVYLLKIFSEKGVQKTKIIKQ